MGAWGSRPSPTLQVALATSATLFLTTPQYLALAEADVAASLADPFSLFLTVVWAWALLYFTLLILVYSALSIYWLREIFHSFRIRVRPLYPDGAGWIGILILFQCCVNQFLT